MYRAYIYILLMYFIGNVFMSLRFTILTAINYKHFFLLASLFDLIVCVFERSVVWLWSIFTQFGLLDPMSVWVSRPIWQYYGTLNNCDQLGV